MLPTGHLRCSSRTWIPNVFSAWLLAHRGSWLANDSCFALWSSQVGLALGQRLFRDWLPLLLAGVGVGVTSLCPELAPRRFPYLMVKEFRSEQLSDLPGGSHSVSGSTEIRTQIRQDSGRLRALRLGVGPEEVERCPKDTEGVGPMPYPLKVCQGPLLSLWA